MSIRKIAVASFEFAKPQTSMSRVSSNMQDKLGGLEFTRRPEMLYVAVRAISSRVNQNLDAFPSEELEKAHSTFISRPVFVNHHNDDPSRTRGKVVASKYLTGGNDKYIKLVIEVDAKNFPRLAREIVAGNIDSVSMGTDVKMTICSYCYNVAESPLDFCDHVLHHKGQVLDRTSSSGKKESVLVYEECRGLNFFEISFVFDPADETAVAQEVLAPEGYKLGKRVAFGEPTQPPKVDTLRDEKVCDKCGSEIDGDTCDQCGYEMPVEGLDEPDLDAHERIEPSRVEVPEQEQGAPGSKKELANPEEERRVSRKLLKERIAQARKRLAADEVLDQGGSALVDTPGYEAPEFTTQEFRNQGDEQDPENLDEGLGPEIDLDADARVDVETESGAVTARRRRAHRRRRASLEAEFGTDWEDFQAQGGGGPDEWLDYLNIDPSDDGQFVRAANEFYNSKDPEAYRLGRRRARRTDRSKMNTSKRARRKVSEYNIGDEYEISYMGPPQLVTFVGNDEDGDPVVQYNGGDQDTYDLEVFNQHARPTGRPGAEEPSGIKGRNARRKRARRKVTAKGEWNNYSPGTWEYGANPEDHDRWEEFYAVSTDSDDNEHGLPANSWMVGEAGPGGREIARGEAGSPEEAQKAAEEAYWGNIDNPDYGFSFHGRRRKRARRKSRVLMTEAARRLLAETDDVQVAQPDQKSDVEAPVDTTSDEGEESQYRRDKYDNNASENLRHETDETSNLGWIAEGRAKRATAKMAMELAEAYVETGAINRDSRFEYFAKFEQQPAYRVREKLDLLKKVQASSKREADRQQAQVQQRAASRSQVPQTAGRRSNPSMSVKSTSANKVRNTAGDDGLLFL